MALCTQADIEELLQIQFGNPTDGAIEQYMDFSSAAIETYLGYPVETGARTETLDGWRILGSKLWLANIPVTAITTINETMGGTTTLLVASDDFVLLPGQASVVRIWEGNFDREREWGHGLQNIAVEYVSGYTTVPEEIKIICARVAGRMFLEGAAFAQNDNVGIVREAIGDYRVSYADPAVEKIGSGDWLTDHDRNILSRFRRLTFA
jgi:hypothetical protein